MPSPNADVTAYLHGYYGATSPRYAVLLSGPWGSGKTWLVRDSLGTAVPQKKFVYISLYGVSTSQQIDEEIFRQLHPVLGSKGSRLAGAALKSILQLGLKFDLDGDHRDDVNVTARAPDIALPEFLRNTADHIIVFDDLERASMSIIDLLGYINHFVEHQDSKVVVIANETEIDTTSSDGKYRAIKEKLIGRTLAVVPDVNDALPTFIAEMTLLTAREVAARSCESIGAIFRASSFNNLRNLRHALLEFDRLMNSLNVRHRQCLEVPADLLLVQLALSFEVRSGALAVGQITQLNEWSVAAAQRRTGREAEDDAATRFFQKYRSYLPSDWLLSLESWQRIFATGLFDSVAINRQLDQCHYYYDQNTPKWKQLWRFFEISDSRIEQLRDELLPNFLGSNLTDAEEIAHLLGIFLMLSEWGVVSTPSSVLLASAQTGIERLLAAGGLASQGAMLLAIESESGSSSLGFQGRDSPAFVEFRRYVSESRRRVLELQFPAKAAALLRLLVDDPGAFRASLVVFGNRDCDYFKIPILRWIEHSAFVDAVAAASPDGLRALNTVVRERYGSSPHVDLLSEEPWLAEAATRLIELADRRRGRASAYTIRMIAENVRKSVETMRAQVAVQSVAIT